MASRSQGGRVMADRPLRTQRSTRRVVQATSPHHVSLQRWADRSFHALLAAAALITAGLIAVIVNLWPLYAHEIIRFCHRSWSTLVAHLPAAGAFALPVGLAVLAGLGVRACLQQLLASRRFIRAIRSRRAPIPPSLQQLSHELGIADRLDVIRDERAYAFCYGLWRPRVCLSTQLLTLLNPEELRALLVHERHHLHRRDPLRKLLTRTLARALGIFPIMDDLARHCQLAQEIAADDAAIRDSGSPLPLAAALLKLWEAAHPTLSPTVVGALSVTEARIAYLLHGQIIPSRLSGSRLIATGMVLLGIALAGLLGGMTMQTFPIGTQECLNAISWLR